MYVSGTVCMYSYVYVCTCMTFVFQALWSAVSCVSAEGPHQLHTRPDLGCHRLGEQRDIKSPSSLSYTRRGGGVVSL